jgi:hypothetical protein
MKNDFVANGAERLFEGRRAKRLDAARAKYADEWSKAGALTSIRLRWLLWLESLKPERDSRSPSLGTLW